MVYGKIAAVQIDPVEKKPLFHFYPGSNVLSIGTTGCDFHCLFCQNYMTSQAYPDEYPCREYTPEEIVDEAVENACEGIAYTYNEPTVFYEFAYDTCRLAKKKGLFNIFVTSGYLEEAPLKKISRYLDAANIDLKSFSRDFYQDVCAGINFDKVLETIKNYQKHKIYFELTNMVIPGKNDSMKEIKNMCRWIVEELGENVPLHFSRFYPCYKMANIQPTPIRTLHKAYNIARKQGIRYVYVGNVPGDKYSNTYCYKCSQLLIKRYGNTVVKNNLVNGRCPKCGEQLLFQ